ncbi:hypothetical protein J5Y09_24120 [Roseomonas sp. PWR1]|uniref:VCBS repeat-containing protein n=1 Tax=Roseomonas nitratireducens TaxID=2820810 RepID=A0ABS4B0B3_9PROT|nr:hypothetical protein [Neoroseomonas nitratireducens]MBP0467031.1 hypothetical protein [Neoroseomonas nitratireducens]
MLLCLAIPVQAAWSRETRLPWRFMDPVAVAALDGVRRSAEVYAEEFTRNFDADDRQGRHQAGREPLNFDATDLFYAIADLDGNGRPDVFLLPLGPGSSGSTARAMGTLMLQAGTGHWRVACLFEERVAGVRPADPGVLVSAAGSGSTGLRRFRTQTGPFGWARSGDGSDRMECVPLYSRMQGGRIRPGERVARWQSIDRAAASALSDFRNSAHPIADAMAINHEGDRIGVDRAPGRPRNFDAASDLLYAVRPHGRGNLVFLLFDWPMPRQDGGPLPGVVMLWDGQEERARIACTIHDRGDRGAGGGVTLLDARGAGLRDFRTSAGRYAWRAAPDGAGPPECHLVGPR